MNSVADWLNSILGSPWARLVTLILAIIGPLLAIFFYSKGRKERLPCYDTLGFNLVKSFKGRFEALQVLYDGRLVHDLTVTRVILWNAGRETIRAEDVAGNDPIAIRPTTQCVILDAKVVQKNNLASQFEVDLRNSNVICRFEYLDKDEGAVIQIVHTGGGAHLIEVGGSVKGAGRLVRKEIDVTAYRTRRQRIAFAVLMAVLSLAAIWANIGVYLGQEQLRWDALLYPAVLLVTTFYAYRGWRSVPKGLEAFCERF